MRQVSQKDEAKAYLKAAGISLILFIAGFGGYILIFGRG
jgi:hypothetical protein